MANRLLMPNAVSCGARKRIVAGREARRNQFVNNNLAFPVREKDDILRADCRYHIAIDSQLVRKTDLREGAMLENDTTIAMRQDVERSAVRMGGEGIAIKQHVLDLNLITHVDATREVGHQMDVCKRQCGTHRRAGRAPAAALSSAHRAIRPREARKAFT